MKKLNNNVKIFCVESALKALVNHGILPDMFCIIDLVEVVYEQIRGMEDLKIPMCFLSTASNTTVEKYQGPKYMFYNEPKYDKIIIETGKSVATAGLLSFKSWIERHIQRHSRIRYINCSKGARIEGTEEIDIEDAIIELNELKKIPNN